MYFVFFLFLSSSVSISFSLFHAFSSVSYALLSLFFTVHKLKTDVSWISRHFDKQWNVSFSRQCLCDHIINKFSVLPLNFHPFLSFERWTWCEHSTLNTLQNSSFALFGEKHKINLEFAIDCYPYDKINHINLLFNTNPIPSAQTSWCIYFNHRFTHGYMIFNATF